MLKPSKRLRHREHLVVIIEKQRVSLQLERVALLHVHEHGCRQRHHRVGQTHEDATQLTTGFGLIPIANVSASFISWELDGALGVPRAALHHALHQLVRLLGALREGGWNALRSRRRPGSEGESGASLEGEERALPTCHQAPRNTPEGQ